jgi:hypothetical protein
MDKNISMALYVMILSRSLTFQGPKKSQFHGRPLIMALFMDVGRLKTIKYSAK